MVIDPEIRLPPTKAVPKGRRGARLECACGNVYEAELGSLVPRGEGGRINTTSCGCARRESSSRIGKQTIAQVQAARWADRGLNGLTAERHRDYQRWVNMMARCYNPDYPKYARWGGRGIKVCERWHDFSLFLEDIDRLLGPCPEGLTLDRWPDKDGDYKEGNVRWASYAQQNYNQGKREGATSQYRGVSWDARRGKWQARITVAGHCVSLGRFAVEKDASAAYQAALRSVEA